MTASGHARTWEIHRSGVVQGPLRTSQLKRMVADGTVEPDTPVRCVGETKWRRAKQLIGLFDRTSN